MEDLTKIHLYAYVRALMYPVKLEKCVENYEPNPLGVGKRQEKKAIGENMCAFGNTPDGGVNGIKLMRC